MFFALLLAQADPAALVERLGSDDIEVRQRAEADLVRLGATSEAALEKGTRSPDREIAARSARILFELIAPHRLEAKAELAHLRAHLREAILRKRVDDAHVLVDALLQVDPEHPLIDDFLDSFEAWFGPSRDVVLRKIETSTGFVRVPDRATWAARRLKMMEAVASTPSPACCVPCARWRLSTMKVGLRFENARVEEILEYLKDIGGLTIVLAVDTRFEHAATLSAKDVTLGEALERVLAPYGMAGRVTEEGVVLVEVGP
jgi:hypothetical protein